MAVSISGNGHRKRAPERRRLSRRTRLALLGGVMLAAVVAALVVGYLRDRGWIRVGTLFGVRQARVLYVSNLHLFVVANGAHPLALADRTAGGLRVLFCPAAAVFQDRGGSVFDRFGRRISGPAAMGLTRVAIRVKNGDVDVKPSDLSSGPAEASSTANPAGALCDAWGAEGPRGFLKS